MTVCDLWSDKDKDNDKDTIWVKILTTRKSLQHILMSSSPPPLLFRHKDKDKDNFGVLSHGVLYQCHPHLPLFRHLPLHHLSRHVRFQKMRRPVISFSRMSGNFEKKNWNRFVVELEVLKMVHGSPEIPYSTAEIKTSVSQTYQRVFTARNL